MFDFLGDKKPVIELHYAGKQYGVNVR